nr:reverse transcriptase domain-containing protein [Tanacetum cinerariifolium]
MNNNHNQEPPPQSNNCPPLMVRPNGQAPRTMEELCQMSINGRGGLIASIPNQATDFGLRHHMIQQVQNTCQFYGLPGGDANRHIDKFLEITQHMKQNGREELIQKTPEECYELIENMTAHHNHWDTLAIRDETSRNISSTSTTESPEVVRQLEMMNKNFLEMIREFQTIKAVDTKCETYGGPHSFTECPVIGGYTQETAYATTGGDFILEEIEAYLTSKSIPPRINDTDFDVKGDIRLLEELLNKDPSSSPLPPKELNVEEIITVKSSIDEPPKLELKELPSHLEYAFLEGTDKLPVIISKELKYEEKSSLLKALKSHKRAIAWKISNIKGNEFYCFLDGFSRYFQIPIDPQDQEKTTVTCPYGTFPYRRMPFGLCNALGTFQRCMMAIFHDMIEKTMEVFMDDFLVFGDSFSSRLSHLDKMLQRCEDTNLVLNWEKCHFMVKEGIVLGHKISKSGIKVARAKVDVIAKLPHLTSVKGVRSFLGHAGFYHRFIQDFSKITRPMTHLLENETLFNFSKECIESSNTLKKKLTEAPILVAPDWDLPFEIMYDASDYAIVLSKTIVYTDHSDLKYLLAKHDAKPRLLWWIRLLQEFDAIIRDKKGAKNLTADYLSRLENPHRDDLEKKEITETFPLETPGVLSMEDEEVPLVDGVFEGALGALGDES